MPHSEPADPVQQALALHYDELRRERRDRRGHHQPSPVSVDGVVVGEVECVRLSDREWWQDYAGVLPCGSRQLPTGVYPRIERPHSPANAGLLLLALNRYYPLECGNALYPKGRVRKAA